nr:diguanylate cyclase [Quadrisphaera sp. RL12-1S]
MLGAALLAPATLALDLLTHRGAASWPAVAASGAVSVLVVCRLGLALRVTAASLSELELARRALEHQANHDVLTGLPHRAAVVERLTSALTAAAAGGPGVGVLFVDLDGFKSVNDTQGHRAGDEVLRAVAARLASCLREGDVAGRWGGDEFVVVLTALEDDDGDGGEGALLRVARRVVAEVAEPVASADLAVPATVGASVGAALARRGTARTADAVLHDADTAAYRAKAAGRGRVELSGTARVPGLRLPAPR